MPKTGTTNNKATTNAHELTQILKALYSSLFVSIGGSNNIKVRKTGATNKHELTQILRALYSSLFEFISGSNNIQTGYTHAKS